MEPLRRDFAASAHSVGMTRARCWVLISLLLAVASCDRGAPDVSDISLDELSAKLGLWFPADTVLLEVRAERGLDDALFAKIAFRVGGWGRFVRSASLSEADFTEDKRYLLGPDVGAWDPERPVSLPTAQSQLSNGAYLNIGVDRHDPIQVFVYLMWHET